MTIRIPSASPFAAPASPLREAAQGHRYRLRAVTVAVLLAVSIAGCSSDDDDGPPARDDGATGTAGTATSGGGGGDSSGTGGGGTGGTGIDGTATGESDAGTGADDGDGGTGSDTGGDTGSGTGGDTDGVGLSPLTSVGPAGYVRMAGVEACSVEDLNAWIDHDMRDYYIYYDQVPQVNLADYDDPANLLAALIVPPDRFSFLTGAQTFGQQFDEGVREGYGFAIDAAGDGTLRFRTVEGGSPASEAGIARGDVLVSVGGVPAGELTDERFAELVDAADETPPTFEVQTPGEEPRAIALSPARYEFVSAEASVLTKESTGQRVGVLEISGFFGPTEVEIDQGVARFEEEGIDELIVDLRYNGGGRSVVAQRLASQIAGATVDGEVYESSRFNDRYSEADFERLFQASEPTLALSRLIVLTTATTASASESLINGLAPYIDVVTVGTRTTGKPFASIPVNYCDRTLVAEGVLSSNAAGVSVLGGIEPDCRVEDEFLFPAEDPRDALLNAALGYVDTGTCTNEPAAAPPPKRGDAPFHESPMTWPAELERPMPVAR